MRATFGQACAQDPCPTSNLTAAAALGKVHEAGLVLSGGTQVYVLNPGCPCCCESDDIIDKADPEEGQTT